MTPAEEEDVIQGSVNLGVFARYFGAGKGVILFPIFLVLALGGQVSFIHGEIMTGIHFLHYWSFVSRIHWPPMEYPHTKDR